MRTCRTCVFEKEQAPQFCAGCTNHSNWVQHIEPDQVLIQAGVYEALVRMYDRYMNACLTAPRRPNDPVILNMEGFFNRMIVQGLIQYSEHLAPLEKELGITE